MNLNNAYVVYKYLVKHHTPGKKYLDEMRAAVIELAYALLQDGEDMRERRPEVPKPTRDLSCVFGMGGRKIRSDAIGEVTVAAAPTTNSLAARQFRREQLIQPWRQHMSYACTTKGKCCWEGCPGLTVSAQRKRQRGADTYMHCEECSVDFGKNIFFCNGVYDTKKDWGPTVRNCHLLYHRKYHSKQRQSVSP